jgi:acyl-CoA thioester hydrolase
MTGVTTLRVRYSECDPMGVAHHSAYAPWFEMGRTELLRGVGGAGGGTDYRRMEEHGIFMAVVRLEIRYKRPARYDDVLELHTTLKDVGHVKLEHEYELFRTSDRLLLATASTTLACLDRDGRPREVPVWLKSGDCTRGPDIIDSGG